MRISDWSSDVCSSDLPMRYLAGLARAVRRAGGRIHRDTAYVADRETAEGVEIETAAGHVLQAKAAVFATNSPVNDRIAIHTKQRSEEHTSELQSLMRISYAVFCLKKKKQKKNQHQQP